MNHKFTTPLSENIANIGCGLNHNTSRSPQHIKGKKMFIQIGFGNWESKEKTHQ
jgi:hypothetical protein